MVVINLLIGKIPCPVCS